MKKFLLTLSIAFLCILTFAQNRQIQGRVTDATTKESLPGVSVAIAGTTLGTVTNFEGRYHLEVPVDATELVFSSIGYEKITMTITSDEINVALNESNIKMDEVIVVAYGTEVAKNLTGSVVNVKSDALQRSAQVNPIKALEGNSSGVRISQQSGEPGGEVNIQVRGVNSINGGKKPLYVVDGIPVSSGDFSQVVTSTDILNTIAPDDIESINILKDAASTSLYGSRAANGVVLINTKSGKAGKTRWNFTFEQGITDFSMRSSLEHTMSGAEYTEYSFEAFKNEYLIYYGYFPGEPGFDHENPPGDYDDMLAKAENYAYGELHSTAKIIHPDDNQDGNFDYNNLTDAQKARYFTHARNTNWLDHWFDKGSTQKFNLNVNGGTDKIKYYFSLGSDKTEGMVPQSYFDRLSSKLNLSIKPTDFLTFDYNQTLAYTEQEGNITGGWYYANPIYMLTVANPTQPKYLTDENGEPIDNPSAGFNSNAHNPNTLYGTYGRESKQYRYLGNLKATFYLTDWLNFSTTNALDFILLDETNWKDSTNPDAAVDGGTVERYYRTARTFTTSNLLNFNKTFDKHNVSAFAGYEAQLYEKEHAASGGKGFASDKLLYLDNAAEPSWVGGKFEDDKLLSYLGQAKYNYDGKYFATASIRRDGSGRLSKEQMWDNFWSASLGWKISGESFMSSTDWVNLLKLRASYGTSGKLPLDYYKSQALYSVGGSYNNEPAISMSQLENTQLTWEKSKTLNIGLDYALFNRFSGTIEYYVKNTDGLLNDVPVSFITGFNELQMNKGGLKNEGLEFDLTANIFKTKNFNWDISINGTLMKAIITDLDEPIQSYPYLYEEGESMYSFNLRERAGVNPDNGKELWYTNAEPDENGEIIQPESAFENPFGGGRYVTDVATDANKTIVGDAIPDIYGGITNNLKFKDFDLSFLFTYSLGAQLYNPKWWMSSEGTYIGTYAQSTDAFDYWKEPGDIAKYPRLQYGYRYGNYNSNRMLQDGDYLKLKNLTFGYNLPKRIAEKIKCNSLRLYVNATDLFILTKDKNFDPEVEVSGYGQQVSYFPNMKSYRIGLNVTF